MHNVCHSALEHGTWMAHKALSYTYRRVPLLTREILIIGTTELMTLWWFNNWSQKGCPEYSMHMKIKRRKEKTVPAMNVQLSFYLHIVINYLYMVVYAICFHWKDCVCGAILWWHLIIFRFSHCFIKSDTSEKKSSVVERIDFIRD